jgi:antitoxin (DNA-binding transcriptional repressor) of toxin-antitoxin stability system
MSRMPKKPISITTFRANIYRLVDDMIRTGEPLLITRKGRIHEVRIVPIKAPPQSTQKGKGVGSIKKHSRTP